MASHPRIPTATYRLQFNRYFKFSDAVRILDYLDQLGISDIYSSPFYRAHSNSDHGYDVSNHNELNLAIGHRTDLDILSQALLEKKMGHITDFVPNHMGIIDPTNEWWMDVLENGPSSTYAPFFDIDWDPVKPQLVNKVLLPILGDQYGRVLEQGDIHIQFREGGFFLTYGEWVLPLNPRTYHFILRIALDQLSHYSDEDMYLELESILTGLDYLPVRTELEAEKVRERAREKEVIKRRINRLSNECPQVTEAIELAINQIEGIPGKPRTFDILNDLLDAQAYRLSYWKVAAEEINYRRFFDVNELAAIRVENQEVFDTIHQLLFELFKSEQITGIRIDHIDGLRNPKQYLTALQQSYSKLMNQELPEDGRSIYLIVEKILEEDEQLRKDWPIHGTTGYDFLNDVTQLLVDSDHAEQFSRIYRNFIDRYVHFDSLVYEKKKLVMRVSLASNIKTLGHMLSDLAEHDRLHRDFTLDSLSTVVSEVIACFPVYRTYITKEDSVSEADRQVILQAVRTAKRRNAAIDTSIFDFIRDILLLKDFENFDNVTRETQLDFVLKFQQCTGPIMAKGLEDTAFYIFNRLIALNEVGGHPKQFGLSTESFHEKNRLRVTNSPHGLLTLTTHDTKRSEDVRARIVVLSEIPDEWSSWIERWHDDNTKLKTEVDGEEAPSLNEEYLIYQTLLGTWPLQSDAIDDHYRQRMHRYLLKAIKEAKVNSSWIQPNELWEKAVHQFLDRILEDNSLFRQHFQPVAERIAWHGMLNSLSQTILKLTAPGVPDLYQGTELWDFTLVDPDNRQPVDYEVRIQGLETVNKTSTEELFTNWKDGLIKIQIITKLLNLRKLHTDLFSKGNYNSLYAKGDRAKSCVAFYRRFEEEQLVVIVPRLTTGLTNKEGFDWKDTELLFDDPLSEMKDLFGDRHLKTDRFLLKDLGHFPFGVFYTKTSRDS